MANWKVTMWEKGCKRPLTSEHHGNLNKQQVIDFYGLNAPDIEKYEVTEIK